MTTDKLIAASHGRREPATEPRRDRTFVALLLFTTAGVMVADRLLPWQPGNALMLVLGIELLAWSRAARHLGPLVAGALLTGLGAAVLLVAGPLVAAGPGVIGGTVLAGFTLGWTLLALLAGPVAHRPQRWSWIPAALCGATAAMLFADIDTVASMSGVWWIGPALIASFAAWLLLSGRAR